MNFKYWKPSKQKPWPIHTVSQLFLSISRFVFGAYRRWVLKIKTIKFINTESFIKAYGDALKGKNRFVVAFRHPGDADTHVLYAVFTNLLLPALRKAGIKRTPLPVFLAGADITFWLSAFGNFILRKTGAIPVKHGLPDRRTMDAIIAKIANEPDPVVLAPEGQVTYHCGKVSELDMGVFNLAYMAREKTSPRIPVQILPLAIEYDFGSGTARQWKKYSRFIFELESDIGLPILGALSPRERVLRIWETLVDKAENYYAQNHHAEFDKSLDLYSRQYRVQDQAISVVESWFGITPTGTQIDRVFALRTHISQAMTAAESDNHSMLNQAMRDKKAAELWFVNRHQELADLLVHLDPGYLEEGTSFNKFVEVLANLFDFANRLKGGTIGQRKRLFLRTITIHFDEVMDLPEGKRREAVTQGAEILRDRLNRLAKDYL